MRFLTRIHNTVAAVIIVVLYFSWMQPSLHIRTRIEKVWKGSSRRVVVFGDDWSDTGEYRMAAPPKSTIRDRDSDRGKVWTEALCKEMVCDYVDNFARSIPSNVDVDTIGSMVDTGIFANATAGKRNETLALFDFEAQIQQFINWEKQKRLMSGYLRKTDEWTIFTVFFGIWDLLEYSTLEQADAIHAVDRSIEALFRGLDVLAENARGAIKVVIPRVVDVTFLPRFQLSKNDSTDIFAQNQHQIVFLWTYWNTALSQTAMEWGRGDLYMPDLNGIVMTQVRAKQLYSKQISDATGMGKQTPLFDEVEQPCLSRKLGGGGLQAADVDKCFDPARHLFWDSMHLSGPAHQLIGREAARLVHDNNTVNTDARERAMRGSATGQRESETNTAGFNLKFPPGY